MEDNQQYFFFIYFPRHP